MTTTTHPKPGSPEYERHVQEEIEHYGRVFAEGEGRATLQQPIPPSWQEVERRAAMMVHRRTGGFHDDHVIRRLQAVPGARMLSLGSGACGNEVAIAQKAPGATVVCADLNPGLLELGAARALELGLTMEFMVADLNVAELPSAAFDVVFCAASLHHVIELEWVAEQIRRTLRPDGILVVVDVVAPSGYLMWPQTRAVVQAMFRTLPERFRRNHTQGTGRVDDEVSEIDMRQSGMECVRSGDVLPVLEAAFAVEHFAPYFSISRRFLDTMYGPNYDLSKPLDRALLDWIWELDRHYIENEILRPETFLGVYRNRTTRAGR